MEIKSLSNISFDELFEAFQQAFADYEMQLNKEEFLAMLKRRGFDPKLSFGAFESNNLVSFTCNGIGNFDRTRTAYDTGTGTLKDYRGQGLAAQVFEYSIPFLKEAGIEEYLLEVLQHNTDAVSVYRKIGFEVRREFYYFRAEKSQVKYESRTIDFSCTMLPVNLNEHKEIPTFWDFEPSWQNSIESINRSPGSFISLGVFTGGKLIGYGVVEPASGDITQLAVDKPYRRKGIGSLLFEKLLEINRNTSVKIINTDLTVDSVTAFLKAKNIEPAGKQYEMIKKL